MSIDTEKLTRIVKVVQNDKEQFELLYSQIVKKVYYWCFMVMRNETDALDASQEAMLKIYENVSTLKNPENFIPWAYRVVRNACLDYLKKSNRHDLEISYNNKHEQDLEFNIKEERRDHLPEEAYELKEKKELIIEFIGKLPKKQREVITLFYLEELKIDEIAYVLDYNTGSIKSRLHSGRKNLARQIQEYEEKHKVRLYSLSLLPMFGLILQEHREELCQKQDLSFDESIYKMDIFSPSGNPSSVITTKIMVIVVSTVVSITILIAGGLLLYQQTDNPTTHGEDSVFTNVLEDFDKGKVNPYIESILYPSFPTRTSVEITMQLKKDIPSEDIQIRFEQEEIPFIKDGRKILVLAKTNGEYTITVNERELTFKMDSIDPYALELVEVRKYNTYLKLITNDELKQINIEKTYVEFLGERYQVNDDLTIDGNFNSTILIMVFNKDGQYMEHFANVD